MIGLTPIWAIYEPRHARCVRVWFNAQITYREIVARGREAAEEAPARRQDVFIKLEDLAGQLPQSRLATLRAAFALKHATSRLCSGCLNSRARV